MPPETKFIWRGQGEHIIQACTHHGIYTMDKSQHCDKTPVTFLRFEHHIRKDINLQWEIIRWEGTLERVMDIVKQHHEMLDQKEDLERITQDVHNILHNSKDNDASPPKTQAKGAEN